MEHLYASSTFLSLSDNDSPNSLGSPHTPASPRDTNSPLGLSIDHDEPVDVAPIEDHPYFTSSRCYRPRIKDELQKAVDLWCDDKQKAENLYGPISNWDTSKIKDMSKLFYGKIKFNGNIKNWNTSFVTNMSFMFAGAEIFNQDISQWNVSSVTHMNFMFFGAELFDQQLNSWNVLKVITMEGMFKGASSFNQPLNDWNVGNVKDMSYMFEDASLFNQPLNNWNVSKVQNMRMMFFKAKLFNQSLNNWDISSIYNMTSMFEKASEFNQNINSWKDKNQYLNKEILKVIDNLPYAKDYNKRIFRKPLLLIKEGNRRSNNLRLWSKIPTYESSIIWERYNKIDQNVLIDKNEIDPPDNGYWKLLRDRNSGENYWYKSDNEIVYCPNIPFRGWCLEPCLIETFKMFDGASKFTRDNAQWYNFEPETEA